MATENEEEYFYRINKELIDKKRKETDAQQSAQAALEEKRTLHWMKCPKCGEEMTEIELAGLKVDQCGGCRGIYFDHGELEILMESKEPKGFLGAMKRLFR